MTYIVVLEGFENQGWSDTATLFEPSFYADGLMIYQSLDENTSICIEESMPRGEQHTFIYVAVQREGVSNLDENIEHYRYKRLTQKIKDNFPYYAEHKNILLVVDANKVEISSATYSDFGKQVANELDRHGFVTDNSGVEYIFCDNEIDALDIEYDRYANSSDVQKEVFEEKNNFAAIKNKVIGEVEKLFSEKKRSLEGKSIKWITEKRLESILTEFRKKIDSIDAEDDLTLHSKKPSCILKSLLNEEYSILRELNLFTLIQYPYAKEFDQELYLTLFSLFSLLENAKGDIPDKYWLKIDSTGIDLPYLEEALEHLYSLDIKQNQDIEHSVELIDIESVSFRGEGIEMEEPYLIKLPIFYSKKGESILETEIEGTEKVVEENIHRVQKHILTIKKEIHNYTPQKKEMKLSYREIGKRIRQQQEVPEIGYRDSLQKIIKDKNKFEFEAFIETAINLFRRIPSFFSFIFIGFLLTMVVLIPYVIVNFETLEIQKWYRYLFVLIPFIIYLTVSFVQVHQLKKPLKNILEKYYKRVDALIKRLEMWQGNTIEKYEKLFVQKLEYENRKKLEEIYRKIDERKEKELYHQNRVGILKSQAENIAKTFGLNPEKSNYQPSVDFDMSGKEIMDYALFGKKKRVKDIVIENTKYVEDVSCYGYINTIKLDRVIVGVDDDI